MLTCSTKYDHSDFAIESFTADRILSEEIKSQLTNLAQKPVCDRESVNDILLQLTPQAPFLTEWQALYAMNRLSKEYLRVLQELEVDSLNRTQISGMFEGLVESEFQALSAHKFTEDNPYVFLRLFFIGLDERGKGKIGVVEADYDTRLDLEKSIQNFDRYYNQPDPSKRVMLSIFPDFSPHIHYIAGSLVTAIGRRDIYTCLINAFIADHYQRISVSKGLDQLEQAIFFTANMLPK